MSKAHRGTEEGGGESEKGSSASASSFSLAGGLTELTFKTMHVKAAGSVFLALLVLFPVAVHGPSHRCATYKRNRTCGLKGRSVDLPCRYPKDVQGNQTMEWSTKIGKNKKPKLLKQISAYSSRFQYPKRGNGDCTLKLTDLKPSDTSTYYFIYDMKNETGHGSTCGSDSGVNLAVFDFAVKIETHPKGQNLSAVTVGQRITLTCVPTCPSSLNSPLGYIWYKNQQHSTELKADSQVLSLDPVSYDDTGSYVCAFMGLEDLRSSPTEIRVQRKHRDTAPVSSATPAKDGVPSLSYDSQNSTDQRFNNYQTPANKDLLKVSVTLVTSVSVGFAIGMSLTVLIFKLKCRDKKKRKEYVSSVGKCPNPNTDSYDTLGVRCMSSEYEMLNAVKGCSAEADYENLQLRNFME